MASENKMRKLINKLKGDIALFFLFPVQRIRERVWTFETRCPLRQFPRTVELWLLNIITKSI